MTGFEFSSTYPYIDFMHVFSRFFFEKRMKVLSSPRKSANVVLRDISSSLQSYSLSFFFSHTDTRTLLPSAIRERRIRSPEMRFLCKSCRLTRHTFSVSFIRNPGCIKSWLITIVCEIKEDIWLLRATFVLRTCSNRRNLDNIFWYFINFIIFSSIQCIIFSMQIESMQNWVKS